MDNAYDNRVQEVAYSAMRQYKESPVPTSGLGDLIEKAGVNTLEYRMRHKGKAWKDFSNDVKKCLVPMIAAYKLEKKNENADTA